MYFKSTLIFCGVYFLTSAWSIGLNGEQLKLLDNLFKNYKKTTNGVREKQIAQVVNDSFGLEWKYLKIISGYHPNKPDSMNLYNLLGELAEKVNESSDKISSDKVNTLKPIDVEIFLDEFISRARPHQQRGYLTLQQLPEVFKYWKSVHGALAAKLEELETKNDGEYVMNAVEFLLFMLEIKPAGHGLTLSQVEKFVSLYEARNIKSNSIDPAASERVFKELGITVEQELRLLFKSDLSAEHLLKDLTIVAAERNEAIQENELRVLIPCEVALAINEFNQLDGNGDGLLSPDEYIDFMDQSKTVLADCKPEAIGKVQHYLKKLDGINTINVAVYMEIILFIIKHIGDYAT